MQFLYCRVKYADLFVLPIYIVIYVLSLKGLYFYSNLLNSYSQYYYIEIYLNSSHGELFILSDKEFILSFQTNFLSDSLSQLQFPLQASDA